MTIIFNGHTFKYEIESVCKLFFPCVLFRHEYESYDFSRDDLIITRLKKGRRTTRLLAVIKRQDGMFCSHCVLANGHEKYEDECERLLAVAVYEALSAATGIQVKWGVMTGIRPVKQMNYWLEKGKTKEEVRRIFAEDYLVSPQKIALCEQTLANQVDIIEASKPNSYSLYVSIPFCPSRCSYCSFVSSSIAAPKAKALVEDYVDKLCEELRYIGKIVAGLDLRLETAYIGGGTPTALTAEQLARLTACIDANFPMDTVKEYTIEAGRADTITEEKLRVIRDAGATRISINPQTFNDEVLQNIGRRHTAQDVVDCYELAKKLGFTDINMDFIAGLPGDTLESFRRTIDRAVELSPTNITVHTLTIKRSSNLFHANELDENLKEMETSEMVEYAYQKLTKHGYEPYYLYRQKNTLQNLENVGYCKKGYEGLYNIYIMEEIHTILAAGASAVSKLIRKKSQKVQRIFNYKYPFEYNKDFDTILRRKDEIAEFYQERKG